MSPAGFRCRRRRRPDAPGTAAENDAEALPLNAIETAPSNVRRPMIERVLADLDALETERVLRAAEETER